MARCLLHLGFEPGAGCNRAVGLVADEGVFLIMLRVSLGAAVLLSGVTMTGVSQAEEAAPAITGEATPTHPSAASAEVSINQQQPSRANI